MTGSRERVQLVTGAAGLIGFELVRQLLAEGARVTAVDCYRKGGEEQLGELAGRHAGGLRVVSGDLAEDGVLEALSGPFDTIYHLAAIVGVASVREHPWETLRTNLQSTLRVLELALATGCESFVFASSSENYAAGVDAGHVPLPTPESVPLAIADPREPRWSYAASKIAGEAAVFGAAREGGFRPRIARLHNVYGPRMRPTHVIPELLLRAKQRRDPFVVYGAQQTRAFMHVQDAARALRCMALAEGAAAEVVNVGTSRETRILDLARLVLVLAGHQPELDLREAPPGSVERRVPDVSVLRDLGFQPEVCLEDGLDACWSALHASG